MARQAKKNFPENIKDIYDERLYVEKQLGELKAQLEHLNNKLFELYQDKVKLAYKDKTEPFGIVHVVADGFDVTFDTPKNVSWDQAGLEALYRDGAPVRAKFEISETTYKEFSDQERGYFLPHRTVKPGKIKIVIKDVR